jgi:trimethylamine--corrinoid protein Co-methyltransferase
MQSRIEILAHDECARIHDYSLKLLRDTGLRVRSERARKILGNGGAEVERSGEVVRFPRTLVEQALKTAPRRFKLGARRPGLSLEMNTDQCSLLADGGAVSVLDWDTGELSPGRFDDWLEATRMIDALDEIGIYWSMVQGGFDNSAAGYVGYWRSLLSNCSKHIQDSVDGVQQARLLLEILGIAFGGRQDVRALNPFSFVLCPMSPLEIDSRYTDAYLETAEWALPVAIMPMPLMGATAPASLISTMLTANVEFLGMLCLVQAACPGVATIYAPMPQVVESRTWRYTGGAVENSLLGAATTAMGRYYGLPVEAGTGGTDQYYPGSQASYERALNWMMPALAWPDILVGPGLLGGSTILCLEQLLIDLEVFRRCTRIHDGISTSEENWLEEVLRERGPGASFVGHRSTVSALRRGAFSPGGLGFHGTHEAWKDAGMPDVLDEIHDLRRDILKKHRPLPLDPEIDRELEALAGRIGHVHQ